MMEFRATWLNKISNDKVLHKLDEMPEIFRNDPEFLNIIKIRLVEKLKNAPVGISKHATGSWKLQIPKYLREDPDIINAQAEGILKQIQNGNLTPINIKDDLLSVNKELFNEALKYWCEKMHSWANEDNPTTQPEKIRLGTPVIISETNEFKTAVRDSWLKYLSNPENMAWFYHKAFTRQVPEEVIQSENFEVLKTQLINYICSKLQEIKKSNFSSPSHLNEFKKMTSNYYMAPDWIAGSSTYQNAVKDVCIAALNHKVSFYDSLIPSKMKYKIKNEREQAWINAINQDKSVADQCPSALAYKGELKNLCHDSLVEFILENSPWLKEDIEKHINAQKNENISTKESSTNNFHTWYK